MTNSLLHAKTFLNKRLTAQLVSSFFFFSIACSARNINKAQALRQAQLALLKGGNNQSVTQSLKMQRSKRVSDGANAPLTFTPDANAKYSHPYYWAPFILIGNWR